ncbi:hypothetical protein PUV54_11085 [Hyphococcus flavus]|uniref:DUF1579 domain-containing protein n=1 Tax=Hyphococcus flavus TaxID=1866326 RepID=A0AAE9ZGM7_9PROT|nr:hypothetical protein [Hyphococcus flavus]WDI30501.1 hypothetical protein PUV54_11085 [Hyphococcus flavus]
MHSILTALMLLLAADTSATDLPNYRHACENATFEAWSTSFNEDSSSSSNHDRTAQYCFYEGRGEISEYRSLGQSGEPVFQGASITLWDNDRSVGRTLWVMVGVDGHTDIQLRWEGARLMADGKGHDPKGEFIERWSTDFSRGGDQHFEMSRSYDGGETWIEPFNIIEYLKTPTAPPPLPSEWSQQFEAFAPNLAPEGGMIFLDGTAWGKFSLDDNGSPVGFQFASVAPKNGDWVWRLMSWTFENGIISVDDTSLN